MKLSAVPLLLFIRIRGLTDKCPLVLEGFVIYLFAGSSRDEQEPGHYIDVLRAGKSYLARGTSLDLEHSGVSAGRLRQFSGRHGKDCRRTLRQTSVRTRTSSLGEERIGARVYRGFPVGARARLRIRF